ncbi:MAG: FHA domain-containing protein [Gammaproteobacteria bacterium]|nr:FHA domain-containing protein [Gammaproteobacteria bacterium]
MATWHLVRQGQEGPFVVEGDVIVGRSKQADLRVSEGFVSRRHARLWLEDGNLMVEDLGSANGTFVNGVRISSRVRLDPGDQVSFDETEYHVEQERIPVDPEATLLRAGRTPTAPPAVASGPDRPEAQAAARRPAEETADFAMEFGEELGEEFGEACAEQSATAEAPMDLSMGNARPATETGQAAERPGATVIMSPDEAPSHRPPPPGPVPRPPAPARPSVCWSQVPSKGKLDQLAEGGSRSAGPPSATSTSTRAASPSATPSCTCSRATAGSTGFPVRTESASMATKWTTWP